MNKSIIKIYENLFFLISSIFFFYFFMKWEVFKISAFTGLSSPHHPVMTSASLHMQNTCVTKNFHPRKLPNLDLQYINQKNFYLLFTIFLLHFFSYYSPQKHEKFSRICLQVLHIFKGELYGMSIIVSKKKRLNDTRIFLDFSLEFKQWIYRIIMHRKKILCRFFCVGQWCISFTGHNN